MEECGMNVMPKSCITEECTACTSLAGRVGLLCVMPPTVGESSAVHRVTVGAGSNREDGRELS